MHEEMKKVYTEKLKNKTYIDQRDRFSTNLALRNMSHKEYTIVKARIGKLE